MGWQFEEQEKENMANVHGLGRLSPAITTKAVARNAYVQGYQNCHEQWLTIVKEVLKEQGVDDQGLRQVKDKESIINALESVAHIS